MNALEIQQEIETLKTSGRTNYENCKKLVTLQKALKYLAPVPQEQKSDHVPAGSEAVQPMTVQEAEQWVCSMKNADGTIGAHWSPGAADTIRAQHNIDCGHLEFWVAINMMYSDYCMAAKKNNANTVSFYADMAKAFLEDEDALPNKLERYREYISDQVQQESRG